ncbi:glycosyltransferase [Frankia sp. Mgl5]|uniref:dolichyl-phosphate beta-glucosyltransferase n=1 Tax=Frankia sp. Mgl5 TaxID=2933793 RepID=UPI00200E1651|nr:dolichyl-phosphate beta-glucosyltransferase [Frankia sp. Mgl5]MCK9929521.1 glycosyltransferase [Frankia sp. Mgl5]
MDLVPVSVVIPAYNEALRLPASLPRLLAVVGKIPRAEVIVVDDGSTDGTAGIAEDLLEGFPNHRVVRLPWNCGKGTAVRAGVSAAHGRSIVFMDADGASDVNDLPLLLAALEHAEVALGSRRIGDGATRTSGRRAGSWAFNQITRSLAALDVADTQCGFKAFRHAEAKILFSLARSTGFGFDVEVLSIARSVGYRIAEVPVRWEETPGGTFRITRHTPAMLVDVVRARRYLSRVGLPPVSRRQRLGQLGVVDASELLGRPATPRGAGEPQDAPPGQLPVPAAPTRPGTPARPTARTRPGAPARPVPAARPTTAAAPARPAAVPALPAAPARPPAVPRPTPRPAPAVPAVSVAHGTGRFIPSPSRGEIPGPAPAP